MTPRLCKATVAYPFGAEGKQEGEGERRGKGGQERGRVRVREKSKERRGCTSSYPSSCICDMHL